MKSKAAAKPQQLVNLEPKRAASRAAAVSTKSSTERPGWRRAVGDQSATQELGVRIRAVREAKGLSLAQLSERSGIPDATLSRIENNKMSPTFGLVARAMMGLEVDWIGLMGPRQMAAGERLASFAEPGEGTSTDVRGTTALVLHSSEVARNLPMVVHVRDRDLAEAGGLIGHRGEELCYVLSGKLALHMEGRPPRILKAGASALFDSSIPHAYVAGSSEGAKVLLVVNREFGFPQSAEGPKA
jgi:transcriptional regulator with XRE-family HTH domain